MLITSRHNARVKQIRSLQARKERDRTQLFFVEGVRLVAEATQVRADIELLVIAPELLTSDLGRRVVREHRRGGAPGLEVSADVFQSLASREGESGLGAVVRQRWETLAHLRLAGDQCWVALDAVQYPGNLGTILRTCDATGAQGVILLGNTTDPYDPAAVRASLGAVLSRRLVRTTFAEFAAWKQRHQCVVVGAAADAPADYRTAAYHPPVVLLMGSERAGLSGEQRAVCDTLVKIPMVGRRDSLNLAVATSLLVYEVFRQQRPAAQVST
jgi:TrmH family RNA methyltransferase